MMAIDTSAATIEQDILAVLETVPDPEIPVVSIVDLGIVTGICVSTDQWHVALTPTYSGCPATVAIEQATREALDAAGFADVAIRIVLSPAWSTDMISVAGREKLLKYGIAPPSDETKPAPCPQCGSHDTHEVSRFGSTPCKALWRCNNCLEPFDRFKCH